MHTHMHTYTRTHTCTHTHAHIHTHTYAHAHTYTHTHMHTCTHTGNAQSDGEAMVMDDFREAYAWLRHNTDPDAKVLAWWDYGYQVQHSAPQFRFHSAGICSLVCPLHL